jgi:hypothetical protein
MTSLRRALLLALLAVLVPAGAAHAATYAKDPLSGKLKIKPHKLSFREVEMTELRWRHWGRKVARARGISRILTCSPNCGSGGAQTTATTVWLSRIRVKGGKRRYTCMSWQDDEKVSELPDHGSLNPFNFRPCKPPAQANPAAAARPAVDRCKGIDMGFTKAKVTAEDMGCRKARFVILEWKRKADERSGPPKVVSYALGFRCHFGGTEALLKLNCRKAEKVARARWGG